MTIPALAPIYTWLQALHVIGAIAWMAGLFYLPRLFVYHTMVAPGTAESERMKLMERRLFRQIMAPAMGATWLFGVALMLTPGMIDWSAGWWQLKFLAVLAMSAYHFTLIPWRQGFLHDRNRHSERFYRIANEVPTVLMVVIVIMAIVKPF
jgi:protoporphyrinogen IX oxidase